MQSTVLKLDVTHSALQMRLAEIRFAVDQTVASVKKTLQTKFGGLSSKAVINLLDNNGQKVAALSDDNALLGFYGAQSGYSLHVVQNDKNSILNDLQDVSQVKKYTMSDQQYKKRDGTFLKFKQQMLKKNPQLKSKALAAQNQFEQQSKKIKIDQRCQLHIGKRRGQVKYIGKIKGLGKGYWIGVKLDEPLGDSDGIVEGKQFIECGNKYAAFVRPNQFEVGDFPPLDDFNEDEDEI